MFCFHTTVWLVDDAECGSTVDNGSPGVFRFALSSLPTCITINASHIEMTESRLTSAGLLRLLIPGRAFYFALLRRRCQKTFQATQSVRCQRRVRGTECYALKPSSLVSVEACQGKVAVCRKLARGERAVYFWHLCFQAFPRMVSFFSAIRRKQVSKGLKYSPGTPDGAHVVFCIFFFVHTATVVSPRLPFLEPQA